MMDERIMRYIPKSKREAVYDAWIDSDGYWIMLNDGWESIDGTHTIHEIRTKELRQEIADIRRER